MATFKQVARKRGRYVTRERSFFGLNILVTLMSRYRDILLNTNYNSMTHRVVLLRVDLGNTCDSLYHSHHRIAIDRRYPMFHTNHKICIQYIAIYIF